MVLVVVMIAMVVVVTMLIVNRFECEDCIG